MNPYPARILLLSSAVLLSALPAQAVNWTNQGFSARIDGFNAKETTISTSNVANLTLAWQSTTADINGVVALLEDRGKIFVASADQNGTADLVALNGSTGAELWEVDDYYGGGISAGAGLVFSPCSNGGDDNQEGLCAYDQKNGKQKWFALFACQCDFGASISRPTIDGSDIYVEYGGYSYDENLVKLDARTGAVIWSTQIGQDNEFFGANSGPAVAGGMVYEACQQIVVYQETVNGLCAVSASTGAVVWTYSGNGTNYDQSAVSVSGNTVYFAQVLNTTSNPMLLSALNAQTGALLWSSNGNNGSNQNWFVPPTIAGKSIYWLDDSATLWALNARTGGTLWSTANWGSFCSPNTGWSQPQSVNGVLFITTGCSELGGNYVTIFALDASNGTVLWQDSEGSHPESSASPMIVNGGLYSDCYEVCAWALPGGSARRPKSR